MMRQHGETPTPTPATCCLCCCMHCNVQIKLAKQLQESPVNQHVDRFRYLTHSWLLSLFFDCPPGLGVRCPNATHIADVKAAIEDDIITWHAMPFNPQYEVRRVVCVIMLLEDA
eukprot:GHRQ01036134.1.p1 GENE.GHRQ01036134.1~~GHRQ01036134.1.p1  ORF type:complete len:114 (-),score=16.74 GHRQ01036134.1:227-568(-)